MRRGLENQSSYVLGYKTATFRDLYTLGSKLGHGKSGNTFICVENSTGNRYACKCILKEDLISRQYVDDVRREITILRHLSGHKHILSIKGTYEDASYVYVVMELCTGGELLERIIRRGNYSERKVAEWMKIIVEVVEACHSNGVMHRGLSPENFLLVSKDDDFSLKATDFGLSVFFKPGQIFTYVVGRAYYVAPEVIGKRYGPEADVWTVGVFLYVLLSGVPPFWAESKQGILDAVLKGTIDFESDPWPVISDSGKDLIRKMLNSRPSDRLTAHEILCHPWICETGVAPDHSLDPAVLCRLKQFSVMNKFKKMALHMGKQEHIKRLRFNELYHEKYILEEEIRRHKMKLKEYEATLEDYKVERKHAQQNLERLKVHELEKKLVSFKEDRKSMPSPKGKQAIQTMIDATKISLRQATPSSGVREKYNSASINLDKTKLNDIYEDYVAKCKKHQGLVHDETGNGKKLKTQLEGLVNRLESSTKSLIEVLRSEGKEEDAADVAMGKAIPPRFKSWSSLLS